MAKKKSNNKEWSAYLDKDIKFDFGSMDLSKKKLNKDKLKEDARIDHQKDKQKRKATEEEMKTAFKNAVLNNQKFFKK